MHLAREEILPVVPATLSSLRVSLWELATTAAASLIDRWDK